MCKADAVVGGIALDDDFTQVFLSFVADTAVLTSFDFSKSYSLSIGEFETIVRGLRELRQETTIYPPTEEAYRYGDKGNLEANLDYLAVTVTRSTRPATKRLAYKDPIPSDGVLKRGFSTSSADVMMASKDAKNNADRGLVKARDWAVLGAPACFRQFWIWQAMNPLIRSRRCGEVRLYFIGGRLESILWWPMTKDGDIIVEKVDGVVPLDEMGYVYPICSRISNLTTAWPVSQIL